MPFHLRDVVSNVEASLGFTVSLKLVETIVTVLRTKDGGLQWRSRAGFLFMGVVESQQQRQEREPAAHVLWNSLSLVACIVALLLAVFSAPSKPPPPSAAIVTTTTTTTMGSALHELLGTASHIAALAVARVGLLLLVVPAGNGDSAMPFVTAQSIVNIMFGAVAVSCATALAQASSSSPSAASSSSGGGALISSMLFSNVQRALAQQIASLVPDESARRAVAAFGLCLFPTFAGVLMPQSADDEPPPPLTLQGVVLGIPPSSSRSRPPGLGVGLDDEMHQMFSGSLVRMWVSGLCTTWLNIAIELLITAIDDDQNSGGGGPELSRVAMLVVTGLSICIVWRALHKLVRGVQLFQGYVEWNVASALLGIVRQSVSSSTTTSQQHHVLVISTACVAFFFFDAVRRDILYSSVNRVLFHQVVQVLHSISSIMFTNSLVSWAMELFSDPSSGDDDGGIGDALGMLVVGIVLTRILLKVMTLSPSAEEEEEEDKEGKA